MMEENIAVPQKIKHKLSIQYSNSTSGDVLKELNTQTFCTSVFMAAMFTAAKRWKEPKCPLTDEQIYTMLYNGILFDNGVLWNIIQQWNIIQK